MILIPSLESICLCSILMTSYWFLLASVAVVYKKHEACALRDAVKLIVNMCKTGHHCDVTKNRIALQIWWKGLCINQWGCQETDGNIKGTAGMPGKYWSLCLLHQSLVFFTSLGFGAWCLVGSKAKKKDLG